MVESSGWRKLFGWRFTGSRAFATGIPQPATHWAVGLCSGVDLFAPHGFAFVGLGACRMLVSVGSGF